MGLAGMETSKQTTTTTDINLYILTYLPAGRDHSDPLYQADWMAADLNPWCLWPHCLLSGWVERIQA